MRGSKAKTLGSMFSSAIKAQPKSKSKPEALDAVAEHNSVSSSTVALDCTALSHFVSATSLAKKSNEEEEPSVLDSLSAFVFSGFKSVARSGSDVVEESGASDEPKQDHLTHQISSILIADALVNSQNLEDEEDDETTLDNELDTEWIPSLSRHSLSLRRKEVVQDRKLTWSFSKCQGGRFNRLVNICAKKVGIEAAFDIFGKLGVPKGAVEYDTILKVCVKTARLGNTETIIIEQLNKAFMYLKSMKEHGFQLEEDIYGPFVSYLIEMAMVEEFYFFSDIIRDVNPNTSPRLGYYEMLLWITVDDEEKVQDLCHHMMSEECDTDLIENYLLALWEGGRDKELMQLLRTLDFRTFISTDNLLAIFKSLGKLQWNDLVEKFLLAFKARDFREEDLSNFICSHIVGNPNLAVEDVILSFKNRHAKLEVKPSSASYEKLIRHCCGLREMEAVLHLIDEAIESSLTVSLETIHHVLQSSEESYDFILVHRIYSLIREFKLEADVETFRMMIHLCVRMKNMEVAKNMLRDMEEMKLAPTSTIYNILMVACLQEKNYLGVENVLKQMQKADIQPDSLTFSHLIRISATEEEIDKYWEVLQKSGIEASTPVYMALIQAYVNCGLLEKAKQVVAGKWISGREVYRIKGALVKALAVHGQFSEALNIYKEIKEAGQKVGPKAAISLIEYYEPDGESNILLDLLEELSDPESWLDGYARAILNCVRRKDLSFATNLLKELKDKLSAKDEMILEAILEEAFNVIGDKESSHLQIGMDLLRVVKNDLGLAPPRKCLDFLLHACVAAKDLKNSQIIWKEYDAAGLPHNIISCLRMYQALLASGDHKTANILLTKIPKDDPHVRYVAMASQVTFAGSLIKNTKAKKNEKKKKITEKKTLNGL